MKSVVRSECLELSQNQLSFNRLYDLDVCLETRNGAVCKHQSLKRLNACQGISTEKEWIILWFGLNYFGFVLRMSKFDLVSNC